MKKVYIETSVVSYYTSRPSRDLVTAARQQVTREWWEEMLQQFGTYISALVIEEVKGDDAGHLAEILVSSGTIPEEHSEDALHIALATVNGMDFLLTWNFAHINNAQMKSEIIKVTERHGYECPVICSPDELLGE